MVALEKYARLTMPDGRARTVGYTEASRGCKHLCRHCPIVPVYGGVFRVVDREVVLADIRQQVSAGAQHITFGDPDFFNGTGHAIPIVEAGPRLPDFKFELRRYDQNRTPAEASGVAAEIARHRVPLCDERGGIGG